MRQLSLKKLLLIAVVIFTAACKRERDEVSPDGSSADRIASAESITSFDYVITASQNVVDASSLNLKPGAVVGIEGGTRGSLVIRNLQGSSAAPIIIANKGSKAIFKSSGSYGLKFENSKYIRVTGTGTTGTEYGIEIDGSHIGLTMNDLSTNFEIDHLEIHNIGFAGIMAKTDPTCDEATWGTNFTMRDVSIHHNYVHHTGGEGLYIGNSFYNGGHSTSCGKIRPHAIEGLRVYKNRVAYTDAEGIQVGCALKDAEVYENTVEYFGQDPFASYQNNGIQIGEGSGGKLYNNVIKNGAGNGLIMLGTGDNVVFNNVIINPGGNGVFCDERYTPEKGFTFLNNTIINPGEDGFKVYSEKVPENTIINNIVVNPGSGKFITGMGGPKITESNNNFTTDISSVKFVNASGGDYTLSSSSPCINKGADVSSHGITFDCHRNSRPAGGSYDIGAHEFGGTPTNDGGTTPPPTDPEPNPTPDPGTDASQIKPTDDAFLQGTTVYNHQELRVEAGKRTAYLKFGLAGAVSSAKLRLTVGSDYGNGTIRVHKGSHSNWSSSNLSPSTAPAPAGEVAKLTSAYDIGKTYEFDVTGAITGAGTYTFVVTMDAGGNDVAFSSLEGKVAPVLVVTGGTGGSTPPPPTDPVADISVTSLTLIDAEKNTEIMTLQNGAAINLSTIGTSSFNIRANATSATGSVKFGYNGVANYRTESYAPFALFGDQYPKYNGTPFAPGTHTVAATAYSGATASGTKGTTLTASFTVVNGTVVNTAPVIAPLANVQMSEGESSAVNITATDAEKHAISLTSSGLPSFASLKDNGNGTAAISLKPGSDHAGAYTVTVTATDSKGAKSSATFTVNVKDVPVVATSRFTATDDAYLQGGRGYNLSDLRVEHNRREMAIKFTVKGLGSAPASKAKLRLRVGDDKGYGPIRVYAGSHNNWSENSLYASNMPQVVTEVGSVNTNYNTGDIVEIDVTKAIKGDGTYTLILRKDSGGNDVNFVSKEGGAAPELIVN